MGGETMNNLQEKLAQTIRSRRHDMGMSQEQLAEKIDKTPSFIGQIERGECFPKIETLQALITSLGIDANALFSNESFEKDEVSEIIDLSIHMDAKKRKLLMEFARLLHKMSL